MQGTGGSFNRRAVLISVGQYLGATVLSLLAYWWLYDLWTVSVRQPISPLIDDALSIQAIFKMAVDSPGIYINTHLGAPFAMDLHDMPMPDLAIWGAAKLCGLFTQNHILVRNIVVIGSFPLMTMTSIYAMKRLSVSYVVALGASLLFAFSSFHHWRAIAHVFMALGYFSIPLVAVLAFDLAENRPLFFVSGVRWYRPQWVNSRLTWTTLIWCVVMGVTGSVYFPFYTVYLLLVASVFAASRCRSWLVLLRGIFAVGVVGGSLVLSLSPIIWNNWIHGAAPVIARYPADTERYGFKLAQLVLPVGGSRFEFLRQIGDYYNINGLYGNENQTSYLGAIGVIGFVFLLGWGVQARRRCVRFQLLNLLTLAALLFGTIGGLASLFSFFVNPSIRSNNRICVYIGYFALLAVALLVERFRTRYVSGVARHTAMVAGLTGIVAFGLYEQPAIKNNYTELRAHFDRGKNLVEKIEGSVKEGSAIYEFPYFPFPESGWIHNLSDYALFRPYFHSKSLRWSFGSVKGRRPDAWNAWVSRLPARQAAETMVFAGFSGILVARGGYADGGAALEEGLRSVLGPPKFVDEDVQASFYSLESVERELRSKLKAAEFRQKRREVLSRPFFGWVDGFFPREGIKTCGKKSARFVLDNPSKREQTVEIRATVRVAHPTATVRIVGHGFDRTLRVDASGSPFVARITVPTGENFYRVETVNPPDAPRDFDRHERVCFENAEMSPVEGN